MPNKIRLILLVSIVILCIFTEQGKGQEWLTVSGGGKTPLVRLANSEISLSVAPDLGGKVISLKDKDGFEYLSRSGKAYTWRRADMEYGQSEFDGIDECFPSVTPCEIKLGAWEALAKIPDHGFLWLRKWKTLESAGQITLELEDIDLPFSFRRKISLEGNRITLDYDLKNKSDKEMPYMYVFHPLFKGVSGLSVELPDNMEITVPYSYNNFLASGVWSQLKDENGRPFKDNQYLPGSNRYYKYFTGKPLGGKVELRYPGGKSLRLEYDEKLFPFLAVWASNGTEGGLEHVGLEPSTHALDNLAQVIEKGRQAVLKPGEGISWRIEIIIDQKD